jgi:succinyl-diaminopimelate desuccinylase
VTGIKPVLSASGGTSDARFIKNFCPVVEFGPRNATVHQVDERIEVEELRVLKDIYRAVLDRYFGPA